MNQTAGAGGYVRFDDRQSGESMEFEVGTVLQTTDPAKVAAVLDAAERASTDGWWVVGFVSYEAAGALDPSLVTRDPVPGLPLVWFGLARQARTGSALPELPGAGTLAWQPSWTADEHADRVTALRTAIGAGDIYQCNLTTQLILNAGAGEVEPLGLYRHLLSNQDAGYGSYLDTGRWVIASASPECFFEVKGDRVLSRPMKGTARRGLTDAADRANRERLVASPKERAENLMIVDLIRNDLGKIARPGSVGVDALCSAEAYPTVWQLTSTVSATLDPGRTLTEVFAALFPCGSVTGAPKGSAMAQIARHETAPRGIYCGAIGYLAPADSGERRWRFSVAIRTAVLDREAGRGSYGVGGGITWDSTASGEFAELAAKSRVLFEPTRQAFAVIETLRRESAGYRHLGRHLARLERSAGYFGYPFDEAVLRGRLEAFTPPPGEHILRISLDGSGELRFDCRELSASQQARIAIDTAATPIDTPFRYHKTTVRDAYDNARARNGGQDVILVNPSGQITESTIANVAVRRGDRWLTPPVEDGCLPGIYRGLLLEQGVLTEASITVEDARAADEVALISSVRGWRRVDLIDRAG